MNEGSSRPSLPVLFKHTFRFFRLTCVMGCGIAVLLAVEAVVLWRLGVDYLPKTAVATAGVAGFAIDDTGRWAVSRIIYLRKSRDESLQNEIVLHDMQAPDRPIRLGEVIYPRHVVISSHSDRYVVGCYDGTILTGRAQASERTLQPLVKLPHGANYQLTCSADGELLAAADIHFIYLWRLSDGELLRRMPHASGELRKLLFTKDSEGLLSASNDGHVCLWDVSSERLLFSKYLNVKLQQVHWTTAEHQILLVLAGNEADRRILNLQTGELRSLEPTLSREFDSPLAVSRDGTKIATVRYLVKNKYCIDLWDAQTGQRVKELGGGEGSVNGLLFAADNTLYSWDSKGSLAAWDTSDQRPIWSFCALEWARNEPALQVSRLRRGTGQTGESLDIAAELRPAERFPRSEKSEFNAEVVAFERLDLQLHMLAERQ